jgi:hypothetical protein
MGLPVKQIKEAATTAVLTTIMTTYLSGSQA